MERDDVQLIRSTLSGNDEAFSTLVKKYQDLLLRDSRQMETDVSECSR